jgi:hypothetical protein
LFHTFLKREREREKEKNQRKTEEKKSLFLFFSIKLTSNDWVKWYSLKMSVAAVGELLKQQLLEKIVAVDVGQQQRLMHRMLLNRDVQEEEEEEEVDLNV